MVLPGAGKVNLWAKFSTSMTCSRAPLGKAVDLHVGHGRVQLVVDHLVRLALSAGSTRALWRVSSAEAQDVVDDALAVIIPQPELLVVQRQGHLLQLFLGIFVLYQRQIQCAFGRLGPVAYGRHCRQVLDLASSTSGLIILASSVPSMPAVMPKSPARMVRVDVA